ncbi:protein-tyrosine phosphatase family protein [Brevibacterium sp. UCMA 11752]|uniref:protein-tyrosine phosphatase family protein n=1 Tax=Brevibacterium sp. UCMA 11752 TaxID=2745946 RepID=UPI001F16A9D4|nr:protein-tyrosine phosphatase family protein [Brevibacterium sp. UCMA 11752]MCF2589256.1 protein phosphatase [Brevibacterium sp. UCMA 11752]
MAWERTDPNVLELPSGRLVRGRSLHAASASEETAPGFELILLGKRHEFESQIAAPSAADESRWVKWPDFWLPSDPRDAAEAMHELWKHAESLRVGVACSGGRGRIGTAMACIAIIDGVAPHEAVSLVRRGYDARAVETPWQNRFVEEFTGR